MDNKRAKEIVSSPVMVNVTYDGIPVYIESVNQGNNTAKIHFLNQPNSSQEVSITNLVEQ